MKKVLLGTTALAALGLLPAMAEAADKIELGLSGYYRFYAAIGDLDDGTDASSPTGTEIGAGFREHGVGREGEVHFRGQTTLDNGIKVGVRIELEAETSGDQIDNSYIYFDGGFGRVEMGSMWGPGVIMFYGSPGHVMPGLGNFASQVHVPGPAWANGGGYFASYNWRLDGVNDKVVYYSPRFAGFQVGLSYTPDNKAAVGGVEESGNALNPDSNGGQSEVLTIGANYVQKFQSVDVALYGSYSTSDAEVAGSTGDPDSWNFGAQLGYMGFKVGGSYLKIDEFGGVSNQERREWELGASYGTGPWNFGVAYQNIEADAGLVGFGDNEADYFSVGGTYALGPGILLVGGVQYYDYDSGRNAAGAKTAADGTEYVVVLGTALSF